MDKKLDNYFKINNRTKNILFIIILKQNIIN